MRDFTTETLYLLFPSLKSAGYNFRTVTGYLSNPSDFTLILRHDVDTRPANSLKCAELEYRMGIKGTYYFRTVPKSYDEGIIREITRLGHEIGYHYEDLAVAHGDYDKAIILFEQNLAKLRRLVPIETICMHGSPLSKYDNRKLWDKYDYRDFGITGEPYLDIDFREVLYLTDTGRRWDGERFTLRDKVQSVHIGNGRKQPQSGNGYNELPEIHLHNTFDIITALKNNLLPSVIMMTIHPQRWNSRLMPWIKELIFQNSKNVIKSAIIRATRP